MNELQVFTYQNNEIRTIERDGEPWFVGKDVANALGYSNTKDALIAHVDEEDKRILQRSEIATIENRIPKSALPVNFERADVPNRGLTIINESGLYSLILSSKLPTAKSFKRWITSEVIPSIRKHGAYITKYTLEQMLGSPDFAIRLLTEIKNERERSEKLAQQVEAAKPKIDFYDAVSETSGTLTVEKFAKVLYDKTGITFGRNKMFKWLRDVKMLNRNNIPYQKYMDLGWFQTHEVIRNNQPHVVTSITGKGQQELIKRLMSWYAASKI